MAKPIGILGGTFDPVHHGHLRMAIECYERIDLQEIRLVPLLAPPHRQHPVASPGHRLAMLKIAASDLQGLIIDDCELQRDEVSYTIDTVSKLRQTVGNTPLCLLMGTDAFNTLHTWHRWQELLGQTHIVIAQRHSNRFKPEATELIEIISKHRTDDISELHETSAGRIFEIHIPLLDISATQIRVAFREKRSTAFLLPDGVIDYIQTNNIYQTG